MKPISFWVVLAYVLTYGCVKVAPLISEAASWARANMQLMQNVAALLAVLVVVFNNLGHAQHLWCEFRVARRG